MGGSRTSLGGSIVKVPKFLVHFKTFPIPTSLSATLDNLSVSLGLLLANSLAPSKQAPDTLGKLLTHSWRVPNHVV
ncbi:hypothetical protein B296_00033963 [Ensete ventricosum]|uniref:Uncharacterized protein n=1 Tax=Ensete ventricosum TaxID=4639 RepID=A0A426Y4B7_ENSVE|nr:hypothetical protein B296_00033963 [Ensete ventricosum]